MNKGVVISLVYMGVCLALSLVQSVFNSFYYPQEMAETLKGLSYQMPIYFLAPFITELIWKDRPGHAFFQRVFFRIIIFAGVLMVVSSAVQYAVDQIWYNGMSMEAFLRNIIFSLSGGILRGSLYYVVRVCLEENKSVARDPRPSSDVIDR